MELITWIILIVLLSLTVLYYAKNSGKTEQQYSFPPGPRGIPILGNVFLFSFSSPFQVIADKLSKEWGDMFTINIFGQKLIFLNSPRAVREALTSQEHGDVFAGRPSFPSVGKYIATSTAFLQPNKRWMKQRKLTHKVLKVCGAEMERTVQGEIRHAIDWLDHCRDQRINIDKVLYPSLINIITIMLIGKRLEYGSDVLNNVIRMDMAAARTTSLTTNVLLSAFPFLRYIPLGVGRHVIESETTQEQFIKDYYTTSRDTYDHNTCRGMADELFKNQEESKAVDGSSWLSDESIKAILLEMIGAGSITTRSALYSFFLIILHKPEVARRIQDEIEAVVGTDRLPSLKDQAEMPYTVAAIFELLRYISHVPFALPRAVTKKTNLRNYTIPANTVVIANLWAVHHDKTLWTEPWDFQPSRFLGEDGQLLSVEHANRRNLMPFGQGKRSCVGEVFARSRMFLFITSMLQRFNFCPDVSAPLPSADPRSYSRGLILAPRPITCELNVVNICLNIFASQSQ